MADIHDLLDAAARLAAQLRQLRGHFEALAVVHGREWVDRELQGYPPGAAVPRYREVPCTTWAELASPAGATEVATLPTAHLHRGDRVVIRGGIAYAQEWAAQDGFRLRAGELHRDIDPQRHVLYLRGMPAERAGWRVLKAWETVAIEGLLPMLHDIGEYGRALHQDAVRRQQGTGSPKEQER